MNPRRPECDDCVADGVCDYQNRDDAESCDGND